MEGGGTGEECKGRDDNGSVINPVSTPHIGKWYSSDPICCGD